MSLKAFAEKHTRRCVCRGCIVKTWDAKAY